MVRTRATALGATVLMGLVLGGSACRSAGTAPEGRRTLFWRPAGATPAGPASGAETGEVVAIDAGVIRQDPAEVDIELPEGRVSARRVAAVRPGPDHLVWIGRTAGSPSADVVVTVVGGSVAVHVQRDGGAVVVHGSTPGRGVRTRVPDADITPESEPAVPLDTVGGTGADRQPVTAAAAGAVPVVDVLIVVNSTVAARYGTGLQAVVQNAIDRGNKALGDSRAGLQLRLVHIDQVPDAEIAAGWAGNVANLTRSPRVAQLRDQYGADLVQAWGSYPSVCGQGFQPRTGGFRAAYGFSVINAVNSACMLGVGPIHEMGHNLGVGHDRQADRAQGRPGDAYGLLDEAHDFMTIMAYTRRSCPGGSCTQSWLFSNPALSYRGYPAGRAGSEDNARNLRANAAAVAAYRPTRV